MECRSYSLKQLTEAHNELSINDEKNSICDIEYSNDETLDIKEEISEDYENLSNIDVKLSDNRQCQSQVLNIYQKGLKPKKIKELNEESEKKYKCEKCARS
ncbi:uncharacterized protein LOC117168546 [Belonocnema kinseyi]|uniref:uncharacterized protein LOC117168546 n=1 Tax=Belonocnema kinseyi TaxID=2817044 RepID=UPI00143CD65E|nr:uncharacterized protein LOC117168546 [Belonocnema kinseyi]